LLTKELIFVGQDDGAIFKEWEARKTFSNEATWSFLVRRNEREKMIKCGKSSNCTHMTMKKG
jgi:hypothetical protein